MPACSKNGCKKDATQTIKLLLYAQGHGEPAHFFVSLFACSEDHQTSDGELRKFLEQNWEVLATAFEQRGFPRPILKKTQVAWVPIQDWEEFHRQFENAEDNRKHTAWKN